VTLILPHLQGGAKRSEGGGGKCSRSSQPQPFPCKRRRETKQLRPADDYPRSTPPVRLLTSATIFAATASIS
jgi:hypothetical protein